MSTVQSLGFGITSYHIKILEKFIFSILPSLGKSCAFNERREL